ncbi:hypothetical protein NDI39_02710 [Microcoleus sp. ZQ-A2]|nr:hypothetical protein [Microcoleus sp. FACHB-1]
MEEEGHTTVLTAAIVSGCLIIGLLAGYPLGNIARHAFSGENMALPQQE